jgi:hypothetical protein
MTHAHTRAHADDMQPLVSHTASDEELFSIYETIRAGARAFLWAEYQVLSAPRASLC